MGVIRIRAGAPEDSDLIFHYICELAVYERARNEVTATPAMLHEALFGEQPRAFSLICEIDDEPAGFAIYFYSFSTWLGKYGLFLEDLYVSPGHRGQGAGKALLRYLAHQAVAEGCGRFEWNVLDWNEPAIRFYEACGAVAMSEWEGYRLEGDALQRFATEPGPP